MSEQSSDAILQNVTILGYTKLHRGFCHCVITCISSWISCLPLPLIVVATYLSPLSVKVSQPANRQSTKPLMLQLVWLSPNPSCLTLAIIQSGLQLTGYIMINHSSQGQEEYVVIGTDSSPSLAFSSKEIQSLSKISPLTENYCQAGGERCSHSHLSWHDSEKHNTTYSHLNHLLYNVMKVWKFQCEDCGV